MAKEGVVLTEEELRLMSMFSTLTGISPSDCIIDKKYDRLIFVVEPGSKPPRDRIAKEAMEFFKKKVNKDVEVVEYSDDLVQLIKNALGPRGIMDVKVTNRGGDKIVIVIANPKEKGLVVGRQGRNVEKARLLAKRYYDVDRIQVA